MLACARGGGLPFHNELPCDVHPRREMRAASETFCVASCRFSARRWLSLYSTAHPPPTLRTRITPSHICAHSPTHPPAPRIHARACYGAGHEPEVVAPLVLVVLLIEPAEENFMCGCGAVRWQGHGLVLGQCDLSACLVAHLRMGGCRQSGQMRCGCMHAAC